MTNELKKTPFHQFHIEHGARMVDFGGWHMPVRYTGDKKEHNAVREQVGLFDVSHMGEFLVRGKNAEALLQYITCNNVAKLRDGRIQYNVLMSPQGGFIDDILVYRRQAEDYLVVVNAANQEKDWNWIVEQNQSVGAELIHASESFAQLAIQGPKAVEVVAQLTSVPVQDMKYYHFAEDTFAGVSSIISRTGYTASDGFEVYFHPQHAEVVWNAILDTGKAHDLTLCGLGSRDSLRIEGKMLLYGNDANEETTVLEADLGWVVKLDKGEFIGRDVLARQKEEGVAKKWVGFEMIDRGIPRHGYPVCKQGQPIGEVTSGVYSPTFSKAIGMTYLPIAEAAIGNQIEIEIRGKNLQAVVVPTPFYKIKRQR